MQNKLPKPPWGIIADDLTGAADTAAVFANCGFTTAVVLAPLRATALTAQVIVVSTNSRHDSLLVARREARRACRWLQDHGVHVLYKKMDSTLKGNIVAEVEAIRDAAGFSSALVCPANPAQGRTIRQGVLNVRGENMADLSANFAAQGLLQFVSVQGPIANGKIARALGQDCSFFIADAESEHDLNCLAKAALHSRSPVLLAGSAGMAAELAKILRQFVRNSTVRWSPLINTTLKRVVQEKRIPQPASTSLPTLIFSGTHNPVTQRQIETLIQTGRTALLTLSARCASRARPTLASGVSVIVRIPVHRQSHRVILRHLAAANDLFREGLVGSLLLTGGDTALLVCHWLRAQAIAIAGEIVPGLAWGRFIGGLADGLAVCTKPGGFGDDESLVRAVKFLAFQSPCISRHAEALADKSKIANRKSEINRRLLRSAPISQSAADK